jgi:hypothetical protein
VSQNTIEPKIPDATKDITAASFKTACARATNNKNQKISVFRSGLKRNSSQIPMNAFAATQIADAEPSGVLIDQGGQIIPNLAMGDSTSALR